MHNEQRELKRCMQLLQNRKISNWMFWPQIEQNASEKAFQTSFSSKVKGKRPVR